MSMEVVRRDDGSKDLVWCGLGRSYHHLLGILPRTPGGDLDISAAERDACRRRNRQALGLPAEPRPRPQHLPPGEYPADWIVTAPLFSHLKWDGIWPPASPWPYRPNIVFVDIVNAPDLAGRLGLTESECASFKDYPDQRFVVLGETDVVHSNVGMLGYGYKPAPAYDPVAAARWTRIYAMARPPHAEIMARAIEDMKSDARRQEHDRMRLKHHEERLRERQALERNPLLQLRQLAEQNRLLSEQLAEVQSVLADKTRAENAELLREKLRLEGELTRMQETARTLEEKAQTVVVSRKNK
jgi:hypothetical protein